MWVDMRVILTSIGHAESNLVELKASMKSKSVKGKPQVVGLTQVWNQKVSIKLSRIQSSTTNMQGSSTIELNTMQTKTSREIPYIDIKQYPHHELANFALSCGKDHEPTLGFDAYTTGCSKRHRMLKSALPRCSC